MAWSVIPTTEVEPDGGDDGQAPYRGVSAAPPPGDLGLRSHRAGYCRIDYLPPNSLHRASVGPAFLAATESPTFIGSRRQIEGKGPPPQYVCSLYPRANPLAARP